MSTVINQPPPLHQYGLLWVATPSASFHTKFLDQHLTLYYFPVPVCQVLIRKTVILHGALTILSSPQIPEYCHSLDEPDVLDNAFELIFAFDEIVALGYRENVNLAQIRTFTEMDSHEEKVYEAMRRVSTVSLSVSLSVFLISPSLPLSFKSSH